MISPEMLKKLKGKAPMSPMKKPAMAIDIAVGKPQGKMGAEGSPEEEASESPEEAAMEGDSGMSDGDQGMPDLSAIPTDALQAELDKRMKSGDESDDSGQDDGSGYFQDTGDESKMS